MDTLRKAMILGKAGSYDSCGPKMCEVNVKEGLGGLYHAKAEHKTCKIFKTLMNNTCNFDCSYCQNSSSSNCNQKKVSYEPEELSKLFIYLKNKMGVNGLFLSSGISSNPDYSTQKMIDTVKILRKNKKFLGYIHFKVLPGTSYNLIKEASEYSDRMSINLESPNKSILSEYSSCKDYKIDILRRQSWISRLNLKGGQTTQMILDNISTDKEVLNMCNWEYSNLNMRRIYFSSFRPIKDTPLEKETPQPLSRQMHLYNIDFLVREYNYKIKDFYKIMSNGMLPSIDPKLALALEEFDRPLDINHASYNELIKVPGIGPRTAKKIITQKNIRSFSQLSNMGARIKSARPFLSINGIQQKSLLEY